MTFGTGSLRGGGGGVVDHRLSRQHLINEYRRGRLRQDEICDAHPELLRAAGNVGTPASAPCPICEHDSLRLVTYVFGARLPKHGRVVTDSAALAKLVSGAGGELTAYVVEACAACRWHHLLRVVPLHGSADRAQAMP